MLEIVLKSETISHIGSFPITNTHIASTFVVLLCVLFAYRLKSTKYSLKSQLYNVVEMIVEGFYGIIESTTNRKVATQILPIMATFLVFILANNWIGITPIFGSIGIWEEKHHVETTNTAGPAAHPGEQKAQAPDEHATGSHTESIQAAPTTSQPEDTNENAEKSMVDAHEGQVFVPILRSANSDLNTTLALALMSVVFIQFAAVGSIGIKKYLARFFNFKTPIFFFIGLMEILSEVIKIFSFSFRLFGNIFAGDVLLIVIAYLVPFIAPLPFIALELFAGLIQAIVFTMLTIAFLKSHLAHAEAH